MLNEQQQKEMDQFEEKFWGADHKNVMYIEAGTVNMVSADRLIRRYADAYTEKFNSGFGSVSVFGIVLNELLAEGKIIELKSDEPEVSAEIRDIVDRYENQHTMSSFEFKRHYLSNRALRDFYDAHTGLSTAARAAAQPLNLTADEYRRIPSAVAQKRYRNDASFRAACDKLFAVGRV